MSIDTLVESFFGRFKRTRQKAEAEEHTLLEPPYDRGRYQAGQTGSSGNAIQGPGFFNHAHGFTIHQPTMIENRYQIVNDMLSSGKTVLEHLTPHTILDAVMDSYARNPPPRCHPGTRLRISSTLEKWVCGSKRQSSLIWLHGPAGTGKSAIAQTFAEYCSDLGRLGATFFFSRPNNYNNPECVIPTLAYQLAVFLPEYKALITDQLVNDPQLLQRAPRAQFKRLITGPFTIMQVQEHWSVREPIVIILDGLDECEGEEAQCEIVNMIAEVIRLKKDLPIIWLITSRPEPHLKYVFSRTDFPVYCSREELAIDAASREDVDMYLRDGFATIKARFWDVTPADWPSEVQIVAISRAAYGLFIFASVVLKYIGDSTYADPMARLDNILAFLRRTSGDSAKSPLEALDFLYAQILNEIADNILPITKRILSYYIRIPKLYPTEPYLSSAQALCNFLNVDQSTFYRSLRRLHSVIEIPAPENASECQLRFFHASFEDYLLDINRSGKFFIDQEVATAEIAKSCLYWYKPDLALFHCDDGLKFNRSHEHGNLPGLKWVSPENKEISREVATFSEVFCWRTCSFVKKRDPELLAQIHEFDFRHIKLHVFDWPRFASWLWKQDSSTSIIRTEPRDETDLELIAHMESMTGGQPVLPAIFPLESDPVAENCQIRGYFLVGYGPKTSLFWLSRTYRYGRIEMINCEGPSEEQVREYKEWLTEVGWDDSYEYKEMDKSKQDEEGENEQSTTT
ncbi:hypothetical protein D9756_001307 [Leucocoprinus leucothites]|uniref:Nephrocystin 3-like N-terminal domain-containing protein n=1 Tax=Leucocoprinus leucothites TaxID=201217 RepID=A0A8H5LIK9_9AGAR|nr:hypothetical protein D9756_001307 [Leucoagaricus leucothites]